MRIKKCRICNNNKLVQIGSLGSIAISNFTKTPQKGNTYPLELIYCQNLKEIAKESKGVHIDIGANDGTLLNYSKANTILQYYNIYDRLF